MDEIDQLHYMELANILIRYKNNNLLVSDTIEQIYTLFGVEHGKPASKKS